MTLSSHLAGSLPGSRDYTGIALYRDLYRDCCDWLPDVAYVPLRQNS